MRRIDLLKVNARERSPSKMNRQFVSMFRNSVSKRLADSKGWSTKQMQEASARVARNDLVAKVEPLVRDRLHKEFPREFQASWFEESYTSYDSIDRSPMTISSLKNLLALNGFHKVEKPSGNNTRLYLAEGVVATPPNKLSFNANVIPFASGYQEFTKGMEIDNVGVFGDVHNHLVKANQTKKSKKLMFAQPLERSHLHPDDGTLYNRSTPSPISRKAKKFPDFVQQDITLYRMAENSAARVLDSAYSRWKAFVDQRFVKPVEHTIDSIHAMHTRFHETLEKSLVERIWEAVSTEVSKIHDRYERQHSKQQQAAMIQTGDAVVASLSPLPSSSTPEMNPTRAVEPIKGNSSSSSGNTQRDTITVAAEETKQESTRADIAAPQDELIDEIDFIDIEQKMDDPLETLVVISSRPKAENAPPIAGNDQADDEIIDSVSLYRRMTPSTRILALPNYYVLRHSSASTLVSVSLVVFGALPLAYRSYIFSINYDWLVGSELVATSVVGTITYGIVSWRWRARTSQSKQVHEALGARVGARDEAALLLLKEGAVRSVVESVVEATHGPADTPTGENASLIDHFEWANDFGILKEESAKEMEATGNA